MPAELSVTDIETLIRDPYAVYARRVLRLKALEPLGHVADARARGTALHSALEAFIRDTEAGLPEEPPNGSAARSPPRSPRRALARVRAAWTARLDRAAPWFLAGEVGRRDRAMPLAREIAAAAPSIPLPFAVAAKADRIDHAGTAPMRIYDYKAGAPITPPKELYLQLHIEAAIAEAGGFDGLPPAPAAHLELLGVGKARVEALDGSPEAVADIWDRLGLLIAAYLDGSEPFVARLRPHRVK